MMKPTTESIAVPQEGLVRSAQPNLPRILGDGSHDDTAGIQAALDSGAKIIYLPPPAGHYLISKTLLIHSNQSLVMDRFSEIRLAAGSDCLMITNDDHGNGNTNISLTGGIWNMDGVNQAANPVWGAYKAGKMGVKYDPFRYFGILSRFVNVTHLAVSSLTFRNPVCFGAQLALIHYFTIENITFDYAPPENCMDGIHLDGGCRFGRISNLQGATYDDMVALNADDATCFSACHGPIEDIEIGGLFAENCARAVRLLSTSSPVRRIHISNIFGTYHHNVVLVSRFFHERNTRGIFDQISIDNINASKAVSDYPKHISLPDSDGSNSAIIYVENGVDVGSLSLRDIHRDEQDSSAPCVNIARNASIGSLAVQNLTCINRTGRPIDMIVNDGKIGRLTVRDAYAKSRHCSGRLIVNGGVIGHEHLDNVSMEDDIEGLPAGVIAKCRMITGANHQLFLDDLAKGSARINCGCANVYTDTKGNRWLPDQECFDAAYGSLGAFWADRSDIAINDTVAPGVYRTEAWGTHVVYKIPVPNGTYRVRLHFAETFNQSPGARLISVQVNERILPQAIDPFALSGGFATPYVLDVHDLVVESAMINVDLTQGVEINGIELQRISSRQPPGSSRSTTVSNPHKRKSYPCQYKGTIAASPSTLTRGAGWIKP